MSGMLEAGSRLLPAWDKVDGRHGERLAVVYVRQSTVQQVARHQESTRLQYGLVEPALHLGWARACVEVIDDDQGKSGVSAEGRPGFQRLVAEVGLGHLCWASRCRGWRAPAGTGTSCWRSALCATR